MAAQTTGNLFEELVEIMSRLRGRDGCPWDRKQTHQSITPYLLEEAYEAIEAIEHNDFTHLKEELGDLLLQIVFHAQMAHEANRFTIDDVIQAISEKMVRRHPHVFGEKKLDTAEQVLTSWEQIKKAEKKKDGRQSILDGVPKNLPALLRAQRIQDKASHVGFDWKEIEPVIGKLHEEIDEFKAALTAENRDKIREEIGDILFSLVNISRFLEIDPEDSLRRTTDKFMRRFYYIEQILHERGEDLHNATLEEMDEIWEAAKQLETVSA
ncbi:MAG: nucleoside triphosphate pyrophosphohydrolase [Gemmatimonadetes bacterium]|nr:MAG: nucleoside triphosphate pyrophosphohydrolase [Gemmatimonadota bacterium]